MVRFIESLDEIKTALTDAGEKLVVVDFTATWCGPCKMIGPFFDTLSTKYPEVVFLKVDVDDASDVAAFCDIKCIPTFHFYKNGNRVLEFSGANQASLEQKVQELKYMCNCVCFYSFIFCTL
ncbi:thioredoxin-like [Dendrobates tinctorius]|uniref:thioredoxin-like n=1 Tax=Dendrobates tinctorius TaxID=92724 RepID=UPI003CCA31D0